MKSLMLAALLLVGCQRPLEPPTPTVTPTSAAAAAPATPATPAAPAAGRVAWVVAAQAREPVRETDEFEVFLNVYALSAEGQLTLAHSVPAKETRSDDLAALPGSDLVLTLQDASVDDSSPQSALQSWRLSAQGELKPLKRQPLDLPFDHAHFLPLPGERFLLKNSGPDLHLLQATRDGGCKVVKSVKLPDNFSGGRDDDDFAVDARRSLLLVNHNL